MCAALRGQPRCASALLALGEAFGEADVQRYQRFVKSHSCYWQIFSNVEVAPHSQMVMRDKPIKYGILGLHIIRILAYGMILNISIALLQAAKRN